MLENLTKLVEVDTSKLAWKVDDSRESYETKCGENVSIPTEVYDYDANCNESTRWIYLSQNVFNNDDKYEYLVKSYREVSKPTNPTVYQPGNV